MVDTGAARPIFVRLALGWLLITHIIGGKELTLHKGDVLMLNQQVRHAIRRAEYEDIGINFIALPEFFEVPLSMLHEKNVLAEFIAGAFGQKNPVSQSSPLKILSDNHTRSG